MQAFLKKVKDQARKDPKKIVFPEPSDERVLKAIEVIIHEDKTAVPIVLGTKADIERDIAAYKIDLDLGRDQLEIHDPGTENVNQFGTMMVHSGVADGMISGSLSSTADTVRPALEIIGTKEKFHKVSGLFFLILEEKLLLFADCAIIPHPDAHDLADIATDTAETAQKFGLDPKVALLSFSTNRSADDFTINKIREAIKLIKHEKPDLMVEGEMQVDAALIPEVCKRKFPESQIMGEANVLIFPCLNAGNIAVKLVERLAKAHAIGPILQGLKKPINDLSRGCSYQDIVDLAAFTTYEAQ